MRLTSLILLSAVGVGAHANVQFYNSADFGGNGVARTAWLADLGISAGDTLVDFENYDVGLNLHNVDLGGVSLFHPTTIARVQSSSSFFGSSNPIDTKALALAESTGSISLNFSDPAMYVGGFDIDKPQAELKVTLTDSSVFSFNLESTGSSGNTAEFWGLRSLDPMLGIQKVEFIGTNGGDGEWGIDNLEFGGEPVPEPGTLAALALGLAAIAKRRKRL